MIILFRHAKPVIDYSSCTYNKAVDKLNDYNSTFDLKCDELDSLSDELKTIVLQNNPVIVYSSTLPRAITTADYIFKPLSVNVHNDPIFSEFDLAILKIPKVKLTVKAWFFISRIFWFSGIRNRADSFLHEIKRSKIAAKILEKHYHENTTVILVGHGLMNGFIARYFKNNGFRVKHRKQNNLYTIQ